MGASDVTPDLATLRQRLAEGMAALAAGWRGERDPQTYLHGRARLIDSVLNELWAQHMPQRIALLAVGGYGRGELYPYSDVDLLILLDESGCDRELESAIQRFVGTLWDLGLDVGHSVRTVDECLTEAEADITIKTTLLEARLLCGTQSLADQLHTAYRASFDATAFYKAKRLEMQARHARHNDTPYALEPNCKESPGGLRDLQVILWCARGAEIGRDWSALVDAGLLRQSEARQLAIAERRLQELRIELHLLARRREDRLLFDVQERLAQCFGIGAEGRRRASEILMQRYFRSARRVTLLNSLVLPAIGNQLTPVPQAAPIVIDTNFQTVRDQLDVRDSGVFEREPGAILECFRLQMERHELQGLTQRAQRALWHARHQIDDRFRADPQHRAAFLALFKQRHLVRVLRRMNQYNILGRYLPAFGEIVGRMQHDLFHVYTVDQHILQVIRNLRRFAMPEFAHEYPFCSRLMSGLTKPWLLYLAALFHDIAKGRGGDHSELGMVDAREFCTAHALSAEETELVVFLVRHHLTMASVAQKQDLADPEVVRAFAAMVATPMRLTCLYLLTVADIRGTSPKVWNSWKAKLLEDLFRMTLALLEGGQAPIASGLADRQEAARALLRLRGLRPNVEHELWSKLDTAYFLRHEAETVAWHARVLYHRVDADVPIVQARLEPRIDGIQVMVYVADQPGLFVRLCNLLARQNYSIAEAKIHTTLHGYALDTFVVLAPDSEAQRDQAPLLEHAISENLRCQPPLQPPPTRRLSRQVRHFPIQPEIEIRPDEKGGLHVMTCNAADRSGLLYAVAEVLARHEIRLHTAKITTLGERVEDVFLISGRRLANPVALVRLEQDLLAALAV